VQIDYLILADAVAAVGGKHYIHGAGWDTLFVSSFPVVHPMVSIAVRLRVPWEETNQQHTVEIDVLRDEDDTSILPGPPLRGPFLVDRPANIAPGSDQLMHMGLDLVNLHIQNPGAYTIVFRVDERVLATSKFQVISPPKPSE
jgi:hypothetical protein